MWKVIVIAWSSLGIIGFYRRFIRNGYLMKELDHRGFPGPLRYTISMAIGLIFASVVGPFLIQREEGEDEGD